MNIVGADNQPAFNEGANGSPFVQRVVQEPSNANGFGSSSAALNGAEYGPIGGMHSNQGTPSRVLNRDPFGKPVLDEIQPNVGLGGSFSNHSSPFIQQAQAFPQTPLSQFAGQDNRSLPSVTPISDRQPMPFAQQPFAQSPAYGTSPSPWHAPEGPAFRRPGPFEAVHPTASNTFVAQPLAPSQSFGRGAPGGVPPNHSPWHNTPQPVVNEPWGAPSASLTAANLGQHDEQQRQAELQLQTKKAPPESAPEPEPTPVTPEEPPVQAPPPAPAPTAPSPSDPIVPQKPRRKSTAQPSQAAPQAPKVAPAPSVPIPTAPAKAPSPPPQPEQPKAAWAIDDDRKTKPSAATLNLREIQEAEAKKLEVRRAAERERERAARASQSEDFQPFTASWGLPTSQAGARAPPAIKETPVASPFAAPSPASNTPAVWTNATKAPAAKKTMKEIQEEEERRKKQAAKEKESMAAAARRAYADTTTKVSVAHVASQASC